MLAICTSSFGYEERKGKMPLLLGAVANARVSGYKRGVAIFDLFLRISATAAAYERREPAEQSLPFFTHLFQFQATYDYLLDFELRTQEVCRNPRPALSRFFTTTGYSRSGPRTDRYSNAVARNKLPPATKEHVHYTNGDSNKESTFSVTKFDTLRLLRPTRKGLYTLSNLDQTVPYPMEFLFAFQTNSYEAADVGGVLRQSLSKVLEEYHPLAGRLKLGCDGKMVVDSTGREGGVPFVEAFSDEEMAVAVGDTTAIDQTIVRKLVYSNHRPYETILDVPPLAIQVTRFRCGGMILGASFNHAIFDGVGLTDFFNSWSEIARGFPLSVHPHLDRTILSPRKPPKIQFPHPEFSKLKKPLTPLLIPKQIIVPKSFCLTPTMLSQLRKLAMQNNNNNNNNNNENENDPTTFELISALAWICWTKAKKVGPEETIQIVTAVDGRHKLQPLMPKRYFGNCIVFSCAQSSARELTRQPFSYTVGPVHDAIKAVTEEYVRSTIDFLEVTRKPLEEENTLWITKCTRLPFYEIDFGWGAASQVALVSVLENLVVVLPHGKDSRNLVMSLCLPVDAMEIFQELIESQFNGNLLAWDRRD